MSTRPTGVRIDDIPEPARSRLKERLGITDTVEPKPSKQRVNGGAQKPQARHQSVTEAPKNARAHSTGWRLWALRGLRFVLLGLAMLSLGLGHLLRLTGLGLIRSGRWLREQQNKLP